MRHSLSPAIHNAAFQALGLDWVYVALEVPEGEARAADPQAMRALGIDGLNVTMPHKSDVGQGRRPADADGEGARRGEHGRRASATTCVGDSTDGEGFVDALRADEGLEPAGKRFLVIGAGGAARAVVKAVADAGAAEVVVVARRAERGRRAALGSPAAPGGSDRPTRPSDVDVVVNATPIGMGEVVPLGRRRRRCPSTPSGWRPASSSSTSSTTRWSPRSWRRRGSGASPP